MQEMKKNKKGCCGNSEFFCDAAKAMVQVVLVLLFCTCCQFDEGMRSYSDNPVEIAMEDEKTTAYLAQFYPLWMDIHVMIFLGFGFLMAFVKTGGWSAITYNYLGAASNIFHSILFMGFWRRILVSDHHKWDTKINVTMLEICEGEFCAAAFLITMGALLGKTTLAQLMFIAIAEAFFMSLNAVLLFEVMHVIDIGGAMTIHMFGAFFGLAATYFFENKKAIKDEFNQNNVTYNSQIFALIGTVFLFMYWPSFNAILGVGMARHRAMVNTVLSICASCLSSVYFSRNFVGKIDMEVVANATMAGGVMMGAGCHLITNPGYAQLAGLLAGIVSAVGFYKLKHFLEKTIYLHDTCGVLWLHGVPGILGAIVAVICVACLEPNFINEAQITHMMAKYPDRDIGTQTGYQVAGIVVTLVIAIPTGALFGFIASKLPMPNRQFDDREFFYQVAFGDDTNQYMEQKEEKDKTMSAKVMDESKLQERQEAPLTQKEE